MAGEYSAELRSPPSIDSDGDQIVPDVKLPSDSRD